MLNHSRSVGSLSIVMVTTWCDDPVQLSGRRLVQTGPPDRSSPGTYAHCVTLWPLAARMETCCELITSHETAWLCVCPAHRTGGTASTGGSSWGMFSRGRWRWEAPCPSVPEGRTYVEGLHYKTPQAAWLEALTRWSIRQTWEPCRPTRLLVETDAFTEYESSHTAWIRQLHGPN
jgi:hypothetical protein